MQCLYSFIIRMLLVLCYHLQFAYFICCCALLCVLFFLFVASTHLYYSYTLTWADASTSVRPQNRKESALNCLYGIRSVFHLFTLVFSQIWRPADRHTIDRLFGKCPVMWMPWYLNILFRRSRPRPRRRPLGWRRDVAAAMVSRSVSILLTNYTVG